MTIDPKTIDPAYGHFKEFAKISLGTTNLIHQMREGVIFKDGILPAKHKALMAALWGVSARNLA